MEDILTYIIVFGLIIAGVAFWQFRYSKPRPHLLSKQIYPELDLMLLIEKSEGKTKNFLINISNKKKIDTNIPFVELINKKREIEIVNLNNLKFSKNLSNQESTNSHISYNFLFNDFSKLLKNSEFKFTTFRISLQSSEGKKFKSHELSFNTNWTIYRPDSGKYN